MGTMGLVNGAETDVFIGYNTRDRAQVRAIVEALADCGIRVWWDETSIQPGRLIQDEMENALQSCRSAALFIGPDGIGPWERLEIRVAIGQFVRRGLPVIPVMLDSAGSEPLLPWFLREFRIVRFSGRVDFEAGVRQLIWGITGLPPVDAA
jgi:hypothetical protein